ncbi:MAG: heat-inducible transcriptional repressor HrcA, partial [Alphaproteobacteria bacterium]|nr:heat-inducible transcriptional repressor HrcA [Alphaproteobacteria bacterium]
MQTPNFRAAPPNLTSTAMDSRSTSILRELIQLYVATGEPVGSRTLARRVPLNLSPASSRNVMQGLEEAGLIYAP